MRPGRSLVLALIREPLAHFLVIGAAIFALYDLIADRAPADAKNRIEITAGDIEQLRATWMNKWQRSRDCALSRSARHGARERRYDHQEPPGAEA